MRSPGSFSGAPRFVGGLVLLTAACSSSVNTSSKDAGTDSATADGAVDSGTATDSTVPDSGSPPGDSGPGGDSAMPGDAGGACAAYAMADCNFFQACEPGVLQANWGTLAACMTAMETTCTGAIGVTGSGFSESLATACGAALVTSTAACANGPIPRGVPKMGVCTVVGAGAGGSSCGIAAQCATDDCELTGTTCGVCTSPGSAGTACGPGTGVTCAVGLACGLHNTCTTYVPIGMPCDLGVSTTCTEGADCVVADGGTTGTCQAEGVTAGVACSPDGNGAPRCWNNAGFFCNSAKMCEPIVYGAGGATCGTQDGGAAVDLCAGGTCVAGSCVATVTAGNPCTVGAGECVAGTTCADTNGGATGICTAANTSCGADAGAPPFTFSPTNISLDTILQYAPMAVDEDVATSCSISTATSGPLSDCFTSPLEVVTQTDGSTVNLVVVNSLKVENNGVMQATGPVPIVIVSLTTVTFLGGNLQANSTQTNSLYTGAGGQPDSNSDVKGGGVGGGAPASGSSYVGAGGAAFCGLGGLGGANNAASKVYGNASLRPLLGGSAGGGGTVGGGAGGGAVQIVAAQSINLGMGSYITVGGEGSAGAGAPSAFQNAGGGGSGGSILLEAPAVTVAGTLAANGGGGGGDELATAGDGSNNSTPAAGGTGSANSAAGGSGGAGTTIAGSPGLTQASSNSGGGGGGVGRIRINSAGGAATVTGGVVSPALTTTCATQGGLRAVASGP